MAVKSIDIIKSYLTEGKYPTASELVDTIDTLVSIGQSSGGSGTSELATVATTGDYNDLSNKPTIPTVPTISTNITSDAASDTKTTSPKAVKDFVEGKGYLTQHQDISGKADQTDLEALEGRVETLEQSGSGGGDTTQYSYLKLIPDLDAYTEAPVGEIVKYTGQTNSKYTRGWTYELTETQEVVTVPSGVFAVTVSNAPDSKFNKKFYQTNDTIKYIIPDTSHEYIHEGDGTLKIGDYVYRKASCTTNSTLAVRSKIVDIYTNDWNEHICQLDNNTSFEINPNITALNTLIFESQDGLKIGLASSDVGNDLYSESGFVFFYSDSEYGRCTTSCNVQESEISYNKTVKFWQPILMPSLIDTDAELLSSSHKPVENATLYEELRIEETGSALSVNGTNYPIVELNVSELQKVSQNGDEFYVIQNSNGTKAYKITKEENDDIGFVFTQYGSFICTTEDTDVPIYLYNGVTTESLYPEGSWKSVIIEDIPFSIGGNTYYGINVQDMSVEDLDATETTGSVSVIKSLKAKVAELEAQITQISAQLQNIASN